MTDTYASRSVAMSKFRDSEKGKAIIRESKISAVQFMFDLEGEENKEAAKDLGPAFIYDALELTSKLAITVDGKDYQLECCYEHFSMDDNLVMDMLADVQANLEVSMLNAALPDSAVEVEMLPGATAGEVMDVDLTNYVAEYDDPAEVPEWVWIESKASFIHKDNGSEGIWDHIVNVSLDHGPVPPTLKTLFKSAQDGGFQYILFHQGT